MTSPLQRLLSERRTELLAEWLASLQEDWGGHEQAPYPGVQGARLHALFDDILVVLGGAPQSRFEFDPKGALAGHLRRLVAEQARERADSSRAVAFLRILERIITRHLLADRAAAGEALAEDLLWLGTVLERLTRFTFESYVEIRESIITQQSLSLLELSTPILRLWSRVLLLPLVGVIDTVRARQITERLLEAIARNEARVTILDLTGVPVLDTSVAQHLMKTIDAARLLGTRVVMTGISPEGAQTLTKLGVHFADVISRATLRAGIAEALLLVGLRIAPVEESGR